MWLCLGGYFAWRLVASESVNGWFFANFLLGCVLIVPLLVTHELAHAFVGGLARLRVFEIRIGVGRVLFKGRVGATRISVHSILIGGHTLFAAKSARWLRLRTFVSILAGPALHFLLAAGAMLFLGRDGIEKHLGSSNALFAFDGWAAFIYANAYLFLVNMLPAFRGETRLGMTDGSQLLRIPFLAKPELDDVLAAHLSLEANESLRVGKISQAIQIYTDGLKEHPGNWLLRHDLSCAQLLCGNFEEARCTLSELREAQPPQADENLRLLLDNNLVYAELMTGTRDPQRLALADELSKNMLARRPNVPHFLGTRGSVLVRLGRPVEAIELLNKSYKLHSEQDSRAIISAWLCLAHSALSNLQQARDWLDKARDRPGLPETRMAEDEFRLRCSAHESASKE